LGGILDEDLPPRVPIPPLAEVQIALQTAVADVTADAADDARHRGSPHE